ncbi:hypothetical protein Pmar_PMAR011902 [Perkinsus marinus ATCC 50983]|uniref:Uncharacterized protein n=1 Tax=Perkinsus marinus (strain ATCC 50983 / TXsc) TaxID=423536 RepID=C5LBM9_PERM5|nr:hypothetical protein Pmar_PMAR011902 [Perkinsus marinus ATCC 50983]EER05850.1 hypothetical protein Pmar_PMAR011902 [Perkinsus marinus ATCC 50983]|eukprot:XP_002774034.1 hypothetical protein Pmar_PMAR011902 [Perkinsus marinus ATCC 50983]
MPSSNSAEGRLTSVEGHNSRGGDDLSQDTSVPLTFLSENMHMLNQRLMDIERLLERARQEGSIGYPEDNKYLLEDVEHAQETILEWIREVIPPTQSTASANPFSARLRRSFYAVKPVCKILSGVERVFGIFPRSVEGFGKICCRFDA